MQVKYQPRGERPKRGVTQVVRGRKREERSFLRTLGRNGAIIRRRSEISMLRR